MHTSPGQLLSISFKKIKAGVCGLGTRHATPELGGCFSAGAQRAQSLTGSAVVCALRSPQGQGHPGPPQPAPPFPCQDASEPPPQSGFPMPFGAEFSRKLDVLRMSVTPGALRVHGPVPGGGPGPGPLPTCGCRPPSSFPPSPGGSGAPPAVLKGAMPLPLRAPAKAASLLDPRRPLDSHLGTRHVLGNKYA